MVYVMAKPVAAIGAVTVGRAYPSGGGRLTMAAEMLPVASALLASGSPTRTCRNVKRAGSRQNAADHWLVARPISSEPYRSTGAFAPRMSQMLSAGASASGTLTRLRQLEALHHI